MLRRTRYKSHSALGRDDVHPLQCARSLLVDLFNVIPVANLEQQTDLIWPSARLGSMFGRNNAIGESQMCWLIVALFTLFAKTSSTDPLPHNQKK